MQLNALRYWSIPFLLLAFLPLQAQRIGYIYSQEILVKMPEYMAAKQEVDHMANNWQQEIIDKQAALNVLLNELATEKPLLTENLQQQKIRKINELERELREFQNKRFGYQGMLYLKEEQLMKPIKDKLYQAIDRMCKIKRVDFIFDLSADLAIPYAIKGRNYTKFVMEQLDIPVE